MLLLSILIKFGMKMLVLPVCHEDKERKSVPNKPVSSHKLPGYENEHGLFSVKLLEDIFTKIVNKLR